MQAQPGHPPVRSAWLHALSRLRGRAAGAAFALLLMPIAAGAAPTPAGTVIQASAEVSYVTGGVPHSLVSNTTSLTVDQLVDVAVVATLATVPVRAAETGHAVAFRVVNTGNATETLHLQLTTAVAGNVFDALPRAPALYLDTDGSGALSAGDLPYSPGSNDPVLAPGAAALVLVALDMPAGLADGARSRVELDGRALEGTSTPGTVHSGAGPGGVDVVTGLSGGVGRATVELVASGVDVSLVKSATVAAPDGSSVAQPGARIDYDIAVQVSGSGVVHGLVVFDPIPAATQYVPSTLSVDGVPQSDTADADAGSVSSLPAQVQVSLGDVPAGATHHVRFSVLIN
jgi:uncharacterized repeat protein (TIGR01451 family)